MVEVVDSIQPNMFGMVLQRLVVPETQKVSGSTERKICAVGITRLLCDTPSLLTGQYSQFWTPTLQALIGLFELPEDDSVPDDEHFVEIEDTPGYQNAYSQLAFAGGRPKGSGAAGAATATLAQVPDARAHLAAQLAKVGTAQPGLLPPLVAQLNPDAGGYLQRYLQAANIALV